MSVEIAIDASSWINLSNAAALESILRIPGYEFLFSPLVANECHADCVGDILALAATCALVQLTDDQIDGEVFLELVGEHDLGAGETECLAICLARSEAIFCCDDRKAREIAQALLGGGRVIGSLRLLKWSVEAGLITAAAAFERYQDMKAHGGFLPDVEPDWFNP